MWDRMVMLTRIAAFALAALGLSDWTPACAQVGDTRSNIVVILIDDAALMDFGAFGGEARTPNIDRLARQGVMFSGYHTSPLCSPSRAMLLTGVDNHRTGVSTIEEVLPPEQRGKHGYTLHLEPGVLTIADRLRAAGYRTLMAGKWHLGHGAGDLPNAHGFDRSLALDASGADNWEQKPYMPYYDHAAWFEDGKPAHLPANFYSSNLLVDRLISYIDESPSRTRPYFAYLPFQAVHIPVQAPKAFSDHYKGQFDSGWEDLRAARRKRAEALGLIPPGTEIGGFPNGSRAWASLSTDEKRIYARSMEVYSGMLEAMDASIGRLIEHIEARGELQNTLFVVTSDNGPEPSDPVHAPGMDIWMNLHGYEWSADTLGEKGSIAFIGPEWAAAASSPGYLFKFYTAEGGVHVPLVVSGPGVQSGARVVTPAFVTDITPTLLDFAGVEPTSVKGVEPILGASLKGVLQGLTPRAHAEDEPVGTEVSGNAALYRGDWKLVRIMPPYGDGRWRLFNLANDPGETSDRSAAEPDRMASMQADYLSYAKRVGVLDLPMGYDVQRQVMANTLGKQLSFQWPLLAAAGVLFAGVATALLWLGSLWRRRQRS